MTSKQFLIVSAKVLTAVAAGVAIFVGLGKTIEKREENRSTNKQDPSKQTVQDETANNQEPNSGHKVLNNLRKVQDTCGKIFSVAQSLSTMAENLFRIFSKGRESGFNQNMNYSYGCGSQGFTRLSPNIIQANYNPNNYPGNNRYAW